MIAATNIYDALSYLYAAGATSARDKQTPVWTDYLTNEVTPPPVAEELIPACRRAIREWNDAGRTWQINVEQVASAIRRIRVERVKAMEAESGKLLPDARLDVADELAWRRAAMRAVQIGASREEAVEQAWAAIGGRPPVALPSQPSTASGKLRAQAVLRALAEDSRRPD